MSYELYGDAVGGREFHSAGAQMGSVSLNAEYQAPDVGDALDMGPRLWIHGKRIVPR